MARHYLACDLGAESGRLMLGSLDQGRGDGHGGLSLQEIHRFANTPLRQTGPDGTSIHWDIDRLFAELKAGLAKAAALHIPIVSISTDSWGVDYVFLDANGQRLAPTYHYRDPRTALGMERVKARADWATIFEETGIQFMPLNTLFQLGAESPERLAKAAVFLTIGDAFNHWLSDVARLEESNASTTQLFNPRTRTWSERMLAAANLPARVLPPLVPSGTRLGPIRAVLASETGLAKVEVIAGCTHDTAAAVVGVPAEGDDWAYISSGTWSLMGVESATPVINEASREANFTNEVGFGGTIRLLKNISGMWLVQECRRIWSESGQNFDYSDLATLASQAPAFRSLVNPMDARFLAPSNMVQTIADYCRETNQPAPTDPGATVRCILESLALLYRQTLEQIEQLIGRKTNRVHIVGGGSRNGLLNQFAADAMGVSIEAGPAEATALGNVVVQAIAMGDLPSLAAGRALIRASYPPQIVSPKATAEWAEQRPRFHQLVTR